MLILGHRGCAYYPENTMKAFEEALKIADGIELDVQKTADGVLVISHDENLKRLTGIDINIRRTNFENIKKINIQGEKIPTLSEVLDLVRSKNKFVDIEVKNPDDFIDTYKMVKIFSLEDYVISSFWHKGLYALKLKENAKIGLLYVHEPRPKELEKYFQIADFLKPNYNYVTDDYRTYFKATIPWTVNDVEKAKYFKEWDIFALITDFPDKILEGIKGGKYMVFNSPYLSYFLQMIDKDTVKKENNLISFEAVNYIIPLHIDELSIEGGNIKINKEIPFVWNIGERVNFEIEAKEENPKIKIRVREVGELTFTLKDIRNFLV